MESVMTGTTFQAESIVEIQNELRSLIHDEQWASLPAIAEPESLQMEDSFYLRGESLDLLKCYTIRTDGKLMGYAAFFLYDNPLRGGTKSAECHGLYVLPEARKGWTGIKFIRFAENDLTEAHGVRRFHQHVLAGQPEGRLFEALGYSLVHHEYEKRVD